jgi:hypothetical protein
MGPVLLLIVIEACPLVSTARANEKIRKIAIRTGIQIKGVKIGCVLRTGTKM